MAKAKLFQYAVLKHPKKTNDSKEEGTTIVLVQPTTVLAVDEKTAAIKVARAIPEAEIENLENIEIILQSF
jgi:hypothetical protein